MTDQNSRLSISLYQILEVIGASEHVRLMYSELALTYEILDTACQDERFSVYMFGSSHEGTTTPGLQSYMDVLLCDDTEPVVERLQDAPGYGDSYLMVTDFNTMPGYLYLQRVYNGVPQSVYYRDVDNEEEGNDALGRICSKHIQVGHPEYKERNGPAGTRLGVSEGLIDVDAVPAFRCEKVPLKTNTRLHKDRPSNWLPQTQIQTMKTYGCFFVGVGHPQSQTKSIEWRISFSLQEREFMSSLNPTQHKCYILLKIIKKDIIQPRAGEKSISSYHCKTCLFYVLENTRPEWWTRTNLIQGVRICLSFLLRWVREGNCPNYFIPEENMFDRLHSNVLEKVAPVLIEVLKGLPRFLISIQCDNIGFHLCSYIFGVRLSHIRNKLLDIPEEALHYNIAKHVYLYRNLFLQSAANIQDPKKCIFKTVSIFRETASTDTIRNRSKCDVRAVLRSLMPYIHLQIAQSIMSVIIKNGEAEIPEITLHVFKDFIRKSEDCDLISSKLLLATCYLHAYMLDKCNEILLTCETLLRDFVVSICCCNNFRKYRNESLNKLLRSKRLSREDFRRTCTTGCMLFLPGQADLVHPALQLEMYRSVLTPPGSRDEDREYWFDWILVDSRVYLYFLQYLLHSRTNNAVSKIDAINNLLHLINTDGNLGHREAAYNLLGWIFSQENRVQDALQCFQESWRIRPVHNAAKWHLLNMKLTALRQRVS